MENLKSYYNRNRKKIWGIIIIIAFAFTLLQLANFFAKKSSEAKINSNNETQVTNVNSSAVQSNKSAVTGRSVGEEQSKNEAEAINKFISYCNNQDVESAYNMLTDDCKSNMYTSLSLFQESYYNENFGGEKKQIEIQNWIDNTYKVRIIDNILSTGKSNNGYAKQDYITVKKVDNNYKLNINNYIGYSKINKTTDSNNVKVEVLSRNTYMEREEYKIKVINNTENTIMLDTLENTENTYLEDSNDVKHPFIGNELTEPMLTIPSKQTKEITISFYSSYTSTKKIKNLVFSSVVSDYNEYQLYKKAGQNSYTNVFKIKANV